MYGLEACPLVKSDLLSLGFVVDRFFTKLFKTNNIDVVIERVNSTSSLRCQAHYGENAPHHLIIILSSPAPRVFSVKLHRISFNLCCHSNDVCTIALSHVTTEWRVYLLAVFLFCCFSPYLYVFYVFFSFLPLVC